MQLIGLKIEFSNLDRYYKEISEKYPSGLSISNKSIGDKLFGNYFLEIPDSGIKFKKINYN